jgi:excisionase family DNA binding protein
VESEPILTTTQAARLTGVAPSTVKRWADRGILRFSRTAGGHRRFERGDVERLLRQQVAGSMSDEDPLIGTWIRCLVDARRHEVDSRLLEARSRLGAWCGVSDEVAIALVELGKRWEQGRLSIAQEHVASDCLSRSLARIGDALPSQEGGSRCLLACADGDEHTLGLAMAELCLRERGWAPIWLGRRTPLPEILGMVRGNEVELVALSASAARHDATALGEIADEAAEACEASGVDLVLGGAGAWPDRPSHGQRLTSFAAFSEYLSRADANKGASGRRGPSRFGENSGPRRPRPGSPADA